MEETEILFKTLLDTHCCYSLNKKHNPILTKGAMMILKPACV